MTAAFVDTNVVLYSIAKDPAKRDIARRLLESSPTISTQVVSEAANVCLRKLGFARPQAYDFALEVMSRCIVVPVDADTVRDGAVVAHSLSHWDALIVAAALRAQCTTLYTEDMQAGRRFAESLTVVNPFAAPPNR